MTLAEQMTEQRANYDANSARIIGYLQGYVKAYTKEIERANTQEQREFISQKLFEAVQLSEAWFSRRYEGPLMPEDLKA